jgi:tetratricopeptide (TPR) repeat protein
LVAIDVAQRRVRLTRAGVAAYLDRMGAPIAFMALTLLGYLLLRYSVLDSIGGVDAAPSLPFLREEGRVYSALRAWPEYVRLLFFPLDLSADYAPGVVLPATSFTPMVILGTLLLASTVALALATPLTPMAGLPAAWFFICVFPVSNLVMPIGVLLAERVLYLPSVAVALIAAFAWPSLTARVAQRRWLAPACAALILLAFGARTFIRNPDWKSTRAVWHSLVRDRPELYRSQWINAFYATERGDHETALAYSEIANRIWPDDPALLNEIAAGYIARGQAARAIPLLERAYAIADYLDHTPARMAYAYLSLQRYDRALDASLQSARVGFDPVTTLTLRAQAYEGLGRHQWAAGTWRVVTRRPAGRSWTTWSRLARALARIGDTAASLAAADSAIMLTPAEATAVRSNLEQLRSAIRRNCFAGASSHAAAPKATPSSCVDPTHDWPFLTGRNAKEVANALQNATSAAQSGAFGEAGDGESSHDGTTN